MIFCVGLTGGFASGKSAAASIFAELGAKLIDADEAARALTAPGGGALPLLRKNLGGWAFTAAGDFDRAKVRARVFADAATRRRLEAVLHPQIEKEMRRQMASPGNAPYLLLCIPLLFETGSFIADCRRIVVVDCPAQLQIARARRRDGMTIATARAIIAAQMPRRERRARADEVIKNDADFGALRRAAQTLHKKFIILSQQEREKFISPKERNAS